MKKKYIFCLILHFYVFYHTIGIQIQKFKIIHGGWIEYYKVKGKFFNKNVNQGCQKTDNFIV